jgi:hypothetical protein
MWASQRARNALKPPQRLLGRSGTLSVINQFDGPIITVRDGQFGKTFM